MPETRSRGLAYAAVFALLGSLCMHQLPAPPTALLSILLLSAGMMIWVKTPLRWPIWIVFGFLWTAYRVELSSRIELAPEIAGHDVWVAGWVDSFPSHAAGQVTFSLRLPAAARPAGVPRATIVSFVLKVVIGVCVINPCQCLAN